MTRRRHKTWLIAPVLAVIILSLTLWYNLGLRPAGTGPSVSFTVRAGQNAQTVASDLKHAGLIRNRDAFITFMNFHGLRGQLKAGSFTVSPADSGAKIASILTGAGSGTNRLLIPEGYTLHQIQEAAAEHGITLAQFTAALAETHTNQSLATKPPAVSLEGYLFPDSYEIIPGTTTATSLIDSMLANFDQRVGNTYDQAFAAEGLTLHQGLTLASVVEKEVSKPTDRAIVAQVFLTRIKLGIPLGSDVTVTYASARLGVPFSTTVSSPYNTYSHPGLPPGPICNPGLSSLDAVAHPAKTDYTYFFAGTDGVTHFAHTYAEHQQNIAKYSK